MRFPALLMLLAAFSVIAIPIHYRHLLRSGSTISNSAGCGTEREDGKLRRRGAQNQLRGGLGEFKVGRLIFGSIMGGGWVIVTKKIFEAWMEHRYFNELKNKQAHNITTPDPRGPSFDATNRNLTAEIALTNHAIWHNINQVPTSPQALTAQYNQIYPEYVDPSKLPGKAIIVEEKEAMTVTVTVTAGTPGPTGPPSSLSSPSSSSSNSTGTLPPKAAPTGEGTPRVEPAVSIATILAPAPQPLSYLPVDVPNTASIVQVNAVHVHGKRQALP